MKKFFISVSAALLLFFISCNQPATSTSDTNENSAAAQKNLDASHIVNKAFETGDVSDVDSAVASDFVDHTEMGDKNRDSLKAAIKMVYATNKDMKMEIIKELADDDYVFSLMHFSGTSDGTMMPAGPYDMHAIEVEKFKDGKAIEHWEYMEASEMMKMMGGQNMPAKDTMTRK